MPFEEGNTNRPEAPARKKPKSYEKLIREQKIRNAITQFIDDKFDDVVAEFDSMEAKDKLNFFKDMLPYVIPKYSMIEFIEDNHDSAKSGRWSDQFTAIKSELKKVS
jgi:hypothetical protein